MYAKQEMQLKQYKQHLRAEERSEATIGKYVHDLTAFFAWQGDMELTKELTARWKAYLMEASYAPVSINTMLSALNGFLRFIGREDCRVKFLKVQRKVFRDQSKELTREEYERLVTTARNTGNERLALLLETICATGIRVSEVKYITCEAIANGRTDIALKGKIRTILLPGKLCRKLRKYAKAQKIVSGEIFLTRDGVSLSRTRIWAQMKALCKKADVEPTKVFPHNLRHLFARTFYRVCRDIVRLADVLGHSSIETTRIYLVTTGEEYARQLERLGLIS